MFIEFMKGDLNFMAIIRDCELPDWSFRQLKSYFKHFEKETKKKNLSYEKIPKTLDGF